MAIWTQAEFDTLKAAVASGVLTVTFDGGVTGKRTVTYQSLEAMRALLAEMARDLATQAGTAVTYRLISTRKGV